MQTIKKRFFLFAAAVSSVAAFMPAFGAGDNWKSFTKLNSGLAGNNVASIAMDSDGENVWFGSGEDVLFTGLPGSRGVSRYNTSTDKWTLLNTANGLAHNSVFSIEIDDRFAWFGTRRGISRYEKATGAWTTMDSTNSILEESVIKQLKMDKDDLWIVTNRGKVYRHPLSSGNESSFGVGAGVQVNQMEIDTSNVWFATNDGVRKYDKSNSQWTTYNSSDGLLDNSIACISIDDQSVWLGTKNGVSRLDKNDGSVRNFTAMNSDLADNRIIAVAAEQHFVWFVTENSGVSRMNKDTGEWSTFSSENSGLSENAVQTLAGDAGFLWFGTKNKGISRLEKNSEAWTVLNKSRGLSSDDVFSVAVDTHFVWLGTKEGVNRYEKSTGRLKAYNIQNSGLSDNTILCSAVDKGIIWFGTEVGGLCRYDVQNDRWECYDINNSGIADNNVQCIAVDDKDVWLGSQGQGLSRYSKRDKKWKRYFLDAISFNDRIPSNDIRSIAIDSQYVWVGYLLGFTWGLGEDAGFSRYDKTKNTWYHFTGDFFEGTYLAGNNVQSLGIDGRYVWIGFFEPWWGAMNRYNTANGRLETITYEDGLADRNVWSIGIGPRFNWFGTGSGVNRYDKKKNNMLTFNVSDGLTNNWIRSIGIDHNHVWLGTLGGGVNIFEDQSAPRIIHEPVSDKKPVDQALTISARIEENISVTDAWLFYRPKNQAGFDSVRMENRMADYWSAEIPSIDVSMEGLEYYLRAEDGYNVSFHPWRYPSTIPHSIETYDGTPPTCNLTIQPIQNRSFVFPNDIVLLKGQVDGTHSIPTVYGIALNEFDVTGSLIRRLVLPTDALALNGEGTIRTIDDSLNFGGLDPAVASIGLELTIHESDSVQNQTFQSNRIMVMQDNDFPLCRITEPKEGSEIGINTHIWGTVYDLHFSNYRLECSIGGSPKEWKPILVPNPNVALVDTILGNWYTLDLPDTFYTIKLTALDFANHASSDSVTVKVKKIPILAAHGGIVASTDGKVSLRLSPNAIDHDQPIFINTVDQLPPITDPDLSTTGIGYNFLPAELKLQKPATVEFAYSTNAFHGTDKETQLSIFHWDTRTKQWNRLGGTVDPDKKTIKSVIRELGTYAVMVDHSTLAGGPVLSNVASQPRIFSPQGGGHDTKTAVSFELGKEANVTIKIYNGAGRLVRTLKENEPMFHGSNVVDWDGMDQWGKFCVSGLYIVTIQAEEKMATKTVVVLNKY